MRRFTCVMLAIITIISCKKDAPSFLATGYWRGNIDVVNAAILNRPDGSCRLYTGFHFDDTGGIAAKFEGEYMVLGNEYRASFMRDSALYIMLVSYEVNAKKMVGYSMADQFNYTFQLFKK